MNSLEGLKNEDKIVFLGDLNTKFRNLPVEGVMELFGVFLVLKRIKID